MSATIDYDGRRFAPVATAENGDVDDRTRFDYSQRGSVVWATYRGGGVQMGTLVATVDARGGLDMRYSHVDAHGHLRTGTCLSLPEVLPDGRLRLGRSTGTPRRATTSGRRSLGALWAPVGRARRARRPHGCQRTARRAVPTVWCCSARRIQGIGPKS